MFLIIFIISSTYTNKYLIASPQPKIAFLHTINQAKLEKNSVDFLSQMLVKLFSKYLMNSYQMIPKNEVQEILDRSPPIDVENCVAECEVESAILLKAKYIVASKIAKKDSTYTYTVSLFDSQQKKKLITQQLVANNIEIIESLIFTNLNDTIDLIKKSSLKKEKTAPFIANGKAGIQWIKIEGGTFMMGDDFQTAREKYHREKFPIRVVVRDFYMSMTEITVGQYRACVDARVCSRPASCNWNDRIGDKEHHPINCINWGQARKFAKWVGGDLPSEAQWEYAARSQGKYIQYPWGNQFPTCEMANFDYGCHKGTVEVCRKRGNTEQGLCDMAGNVWEWVLDEYHDLHQESPSNDRAWCTDRMCEKNPAERVYRGGGWIDGANDLKTTFRGSHTSDRHYNNVGFRVSRLSL